MLSSELSDGVSIMLASELSDSVSVMVASEFIFPGERGQLITSKTRGKHFNHSTDYIRLDRCSQAYPTTIAQFLPLNQCDPMTRYYLAISNDENLPKSIFLKQG